MLPSMQQSCEMQIAVQSIQGKVCVADYMLVVAPICERDLVHKEMHHKAAIEMWAAVSGQMIGQHCFDT